MKLDKKAGIGIRNSRLCIPFAIQGLLSGKARAEHPDYRRT